MGLLYANLAVIGQGVGTKAPDNCKIDQICRLFTIRGKILHNVVHHLFCTTRAR